MNIKHVLPAEIESKSFEIIKEMLGDRQLPEDRAHIVMRCIHTSADFDYVDNLYFSESAISTIEAAMKAGCDIVTDTQMAKAGINKRLAGEHGINVHCFIADDDVIKEAKERGTTRATISMERAANLGKPVIFAIGNAPTALIQLYDMIEKGGFTPEAIIAVPVGFVNVIESKELIIKSGVPSIVAKGRKGGSNIAAAIVNAFLYRLFR